MSPWFYIGVDVGTSSVRGALVDERGTVTKTCVKEIGVYTPETGHYEQSSNEIWRACCHVIKYVIQDIALDDIKGIGFDATCSLVVLDDKLNPVTVNQKGDDDQNIIMWLDHRAEKQAEFINETNHEVLKYVGGKMSLEMQSPKLMWLKQNLPETWKRAAHFLDLPDFLTWKATGSLSRSICSVVCKWTYLPGKSWCKDFFAKIGLADLSENNFAKIGSDIRQIGESVGNGISSKASTETGLKIGTSVGVSIIDAHCGGIGAIGCSLNDSDLRCDKNDLSKRIALICGTSSCHMAICKQPLLVPGVWGPYSDVMIPGYSLNEGGQSAVANLLDHIIQSHPAYDELKSISFERGIHPNAYLNEILKEMAEKAESNDVDSMTKCIHVLPDFHGNRSPLADPTMKGMVSGLALDKSIQGLAIQYLATLQALALGTKHILDSMVKAGHEFDAIFLTGGLQKNDFFVQIHANATGLPVVLSRETESVLLGAAILGACAAGNETLEGAMKKMCHVGKIITPQGSTVDFYSRKYNVFLKMLKHQREYKNIMET